MFGSQDRALQWALILIIMKCNKCKFFEVIPMFHIYGNMTNCNHPDSKLDPETSKEEELNNCIYYE